MKIGAVELAVQPVFEGRAPNPAGLLVSRDLMFALGLTEHPHPPARSGPV